MIAHFYQKVYKIVRRRLLTIRLKILDFLPEIIMLLKARLANS